MSRFVCGTWGLRDLPAVSLCTTILSLFQRLQFYAWVAYRWHGASYLSNRGQVIWCWCSRQRRSWLQCQWSRSWSFHLFRFISLTLLIYGLGVISTVVVYPFTAVSSWFIIYFDGCSDIHHLEPIYYLFWWVWSIHDGIGYILNNSILSSRWTQAQIHWTGVLDWPGCWVCSKDAASVRRFRCTICKEHAGLKDRSP